MPKLQAKGHNPYAGYDRVPTTMAESESRVAMAAFKGAVETVLEMATTPNKSQEMERTVMGQLLALKNLYDQMNRDLEQIDLMLAVATDRTMSL